MKTLITSLFLLLTFFSTSAQDLDFVHSYGSSTEGSSNDRIYMSEFKEDQSKFIVAGGYYEQINLEIGSNSSTVFAPEDDLGQGIVAIYSNNNELLDYLSFGPTITKAELLSDTTLIVFGRYSGLTDFDPRPDYSLVEEGSFLGDGFAGVYHLDGTPLWLSYFTSDSGVFTTDMVTNNENIFISGYSTGDDLEITTNSQTFSLPNSSGINSFLLSFDLQGEITWHKSFDNDSSNVRMVSLNIEEESLMVTQRVNSGELDISVNDGSQNVSFSENNNGLVVCYDLITLDVDYYLKMSVTEDGQLGWTKATSNFTSFGNVTAFLCREESLELTTTSETEIIQTTSPINDLDYHYLTCSNKNGLIKWINKGFYFDDLMDIRDIFTDEFGYSYLVGSYQGLISHLTDDLSIEANDSPLDNGFVVRLNPKGNLVWAHNIPSQQGELEVNSVSVNEEQEIIISGYYTGNHDFNFSENTQFVGNYEEENGFLARYAQEPNEAEVFLNVPILHTEIEEGGANSLIYVSINREISEDVIVEATPDEQIDLGNGEGQAVELTFTPDGEKIMSLDVTAFDDLDVEGDHTGTITFSSSGETNFASLDDQTISFDIVDNDPDAVEDHITEDLFSIYPNPATDEIRLTYPKNLAGDAIEQLRILDGYGRIIFEIKDQPKDQPVSVDDLSRGSYILKVNSYGTELTSKLVIQ